MSKEKQKFSVSYARDGVYKNGLRDFLEYRDLGIDNATHGQFRAHVVRVKRDHTGDQDMHTTGLHQHLCDFQMFYVLKGWVTSSMMARRARSRSARVTACCSHRASITTS